VADKKTGETPADELTPEMGGEAEATGETPEAEAFDAVRAKALINKLRDENKELRKLAKDVDVLKLQASQAEEARMAQDKKWEELANKRAKELEDARRELAVSEIKRLRVQVVASKGLNPAFAERLQGTTLEEIEADADALLALFPKPTTEPEPEPKRGAPNIDASGLPIRKAPTSPTVKLTAEELEAARKMGVSPEAYAKNKD